MNGHVTSLVRRNPYITALIALALLISTAIAARADHPDSSGFAIDGIVADANTTQFPDLSGNAKELGPINSNTTKLGVIHQDELPTLDTSNPNGQVDLKNVWFDTNEAGGTNWLYFAWERDSTNGSGVLAIEFQHDGAPEGCDYSQNDQYLIDNCNPWANRQTGDFILVWDQVGNTIEISVRYFDATTNTFGPKDVLDEHEADAALSADTSKGEAVVDLSVILGPAACNQVGNVIPGTVTGNSDNADYKDTVFADIADSLELSNCGTVEISKEDDAGTAMSGVNFQLYNDDGDELFEPEGDDTPATGFQSESLECTTDGTGECDIVDVPFGDYWINETNLDDTNYAADPDLPQKITVSAETSIVTLDFVNPRLRGSILVEKVLAGTTTRVDGATFVIDDDGDGDLETGTQTPIPAVEGETGLFCVDGLLFDDYVVVESAPPTGYEEAPGTETVTVSEASECADRNGEGDSPDATFANRKIPTLTTSADQNGVVVGNEISDTATLTDAASPTGDITFDLYYLAPDGNIEDACAGDPIDSQTATLSDGVAGPVTYTATQPGTYSWIASYPGDDSNTGVSGTCGDDGEVDTVIKDTPSISTSANQEVVIGSEIDDTATVTGGYNPTGDVTFVLYAGTDCDAEDEVYSVTLPLVAGSAGPATYTPTATGTYSWIATYNGDDNNNSVSGVCGESGEVDLVVKDTPTLATTPVLLPNDSATLTGGYGTLGGTISFRLFDTDDCSGDPIFEDLDNDVAGAGTYETDNSTVFITEDGTYSWEVNYTGDPSNNGASSTCTAERYVVDITPDPEA